MLKKLPGLIWTSALVGYLFKRFGPDDPVQWAKSLADRGAALGGEHGLAVVGGSVTDEGTETA